MRRYYICPVIGDGSEFNAFRPKVADYNVSWVGVVAQNPDGTLKRPWSVVLVNTVNHDPLIADPEIRAVPQVALDNTLGSLTQAQRNFLRNLYDELGLDRTWVNNQTTLREVLRYAGRELEVSFSENNFDVAD